MPNPRSLPRAMLLAPMLLAATACAGSPPVSAPPPACSTLVPADWTTGVAHASAPAQEADALAQLKAWIGFATAEAANVEIANGRTKDALGIIKRCEQRDAQAVNKIAHHKVLGLF